MKYTLLALSLMLTGCSAAPLDKLQQNWIEAFNNADSPRIMERAAEMMERSDYIRYSQQAVKFVADRRNGSYAPTESEREFVYFYIARYYLHDRENHPTPLNIAKSDLFMRKLLECSNLHNMSRYLVARIQEMDGVTGSVSQVGVPSGAAYWQFGFGLSGQGVALDDLRPEVAKIVSERQGGTLGGVFHAVAFASLIGANSVAFNDRLGLSEMNHVMSLDVTNQRGVPVQFAGPKQN